MTEEIVTSPEQVLALMEQGVTRRHTGRAAALLPTSAVQPEPFCVSVT